MPHKTSDGKWKWGNVKRDSRKELSRTVYGIWKANGSKGSFHNFYHYGNEYGKSKKHLKEQYSFVTEIEKFKLSKKELKHTRDAIARHLRRIAKTRNEYGDTFSYHPQYRRNLHKMFKDVLKTPDMWDRIQRNPQKMDFLYSASRWRFPVSQSLNGL